MGKPQNNTKSLARDMCMTPAYALQPLLDASRFLRTHPNTTILDPCAGTGNIVDALANAEGYNFTVVGQDICGGKDYKNYVRTYQRDEKGILYLTSPITHPEYNFISNKNRVPPFDIIITNPPWSQDLEFVGRAALGHNCPFAMLVPTDFISTVKFRELHQNISSVRGNDWFQIIHMAPRVAFEMPDNPTAKSANVPTMWFCVRMELPSQLMFVRTDKTITQLKRRV